MIIDKLHKRSVIKVLEPDIPVRKSCVVSAKINCVLVTWDLIKNLDLNPGDEIVVDVRILVERRETEMGRCCL